MNSPPKNYINSYHKLCQTELHRPARNMLQDTGQLTAVLRQSCRTQGIHRSVNHYTKWDNRPSTGAIHALATCTTATNNHCCTVYIIVIHVYFMCSLHQEWQRSRLKKHVLMRLKNLMPRQLLVFMHMSGSQHCRICCLQIDFRIHGIANLSI